MPTSLYELMRQHCELNVHPDLWTAHHLNLVGGQFERVVDVGSESIQSESKVGQRSQKDIELLARTPGRDTKFQVLHKALVGESYAFAKTRKGSGFFFAQRLVNQPEYTTFYRHGQLSDHFHQGSPPLVGYIYYNSVGAGRAKRFLACEDPSGRLNKIGIAIAKKKRAQTFPKDWTADPYYMCILMALAQLQERKLKLSTPSTYTSRLFVIDQLDHEYLYLLEADVTTELLEMLREPKTPTPCVKWPAIRRKKLSFRPYDTFAERLTAELVAPSPLWLAKVSDATNGASDCGTKRPCDNEQGTEGRDKKMRLEGS